MKNMYSEQELREIFLEEFTKALILAVKRERGLREIRHRTIKIKEQPSQIIQLPPPIQIIPPIAQAKLPVASPSPVHQIIPRPIAPPPRSVPMILPPARPIQITSPITAVKAPQRVEEPIPTISIGPLTPETFRNLGLEKLSALLLDPTVLSVECPGPGKQILVNRANITQVSPITLILDEINNLLKILSERTRIPLIQGVFKVAFGNFIITAVISEFVGTRFVIQKRGALAPLPVRRI